MNQRDASPLQTTFRRVAERFRSRRRGLFITATDTGVGKTVAACCIVAALKSEQAGRKVGVFKPMATGCHRQREGLVNEDAQALAFFADSTMPLNRINPIRYEKPLAPAVAAVQEGRPIDFEDLLACWQELQAESEQVVVEGAGGVMVPIDPADPSCTMLDLMRAMDLPVVVVTRARLGTLNHTALTVHALRAAGCRVAGLVMNHSDGIDSEHVDPSLSSNRQWIEKMTGEQVVMVLPRMDVEDVDPASGRLDQTMVDLARRVRWSSLM